MTFAVRHMSVQYGDAEALTDVTLEVEAGEICALMGHSGSGKSSLLRAAAGIVPISSGTVSIGARNVTALPTHERRIGVMFQSYALFPHLNVAQNVSFGISTEVDRDHRVDELLNMVDLAGFQGRAVGDLSGGEQQRVALARTLAPTPDVLLLDEPLGSLDTALRQTLLADMGDIFSTMAIPVVYVTHDPDEAFAIADSLTVLVGGVVDAAGSPQSLWAEPPTVATAQLVGRESVVDAADLPAAMGGNKTGSVLVPTEAVRLAASTDGQLNDAGTTSVTATVLRTVFAGLVSRATIRCGDAALTLDTTADLKRDQEIRITVDTDAIVEFAGAG
jgi:thiamine transport system ATP-binding protein